jgi:hypothetical protein
LGGKYWGESSVDREMSLVVEASWTSLHCPGIKVLEGLPSPLEQQHSSAL